VAASRPVPGSLRGFDLVAGDRPLQGAVRPPRPQSAELDETIEATVADAADNPEVVLQKKSRDQFVRTALTTLLLEHREIIDLVYYHDKSVDECAQILGVPAGTVKTRMFYARKKMAEMVKAA
jgi:RNA polymerase sigma-70 factor (ECF subfamily)